MQVSRDALSSVVFSTGKTNTFLFVCLFVCLIHIKPQATFRLTVLLTCWGEEFEIATVRVIGHLFSPRWRGWFRFKTTQQGPVAVMDHFAAFMLVPLGLLALAFACVFFR